MIALWGEVFNHRTYVLQLSKSFTTKEIIHPVVITLDMKDSRDRYILICDVMGKVVAVEQEWEVGVVDSSFIVNHFLNIRLSIIVRLSRYSSRHDEWTGSRECSREDNDEGM